jgi:hypothetical protein
MNVNGLIE